MTTPAFAPRKNSSLYWIIGGSAIVLLIGCCICGALFFSSSKTSSPNASAPIFSTDLQVRYVVTGSSTSAMITYFNEQGGTEQVDVGLPWEKRFTVARGSALSLVAQNGGSGSITCEIWLNGEKKKTSTSTAQYGIVTCTDFGF